MNATPSPVKTTVTCECPAFAQAHAGEPRGGNLHLVGEPGCVVAPESAEARQARVIVKAMAERTWQA